MWWRQRKRGPLARVWLHILDATPEVDMDRMVPASLGQRLWQVAIALTGLFAMAVLAQSLIELATSS